MRVLPPVIYASELAAMLKWDRCRVVNFLNGAGIALKDGAGRFYTTSPLLRKHCAAVYRSLNGES